ncbi:Chloramphenicol acetyltransferase [Sporomusa silvacetica DSM 10669]|uniref:Chloramphenicol acetyltransferase n=1 Tax=Sporomusa silvacetica DSM 10669 TaxID=1123289 RepID=A0ABZ3IU81_9FIRM|nr:chloramphenicol acetyltransferase [Sporomusa silvacetica DSM 10669]
MIGGRILKYIDLDNWKRKEHFNFFRRMDYPQYNICANIDITKFLSFVRAKKISFNYAMIYASTHIANEVINFRYRIRENRVILHDKLHPSFTYLKADEDDLFKFVTAEMNDDIFSFTEYAERKAENQNDYFNLTDVAGRDDLIYITCIPWVSFTHLSHTISLNKNDSVPRISWGKYFSDNNKVLLPFSVQVHHAFVDGIHVGIYFSKLQNYIDNQIIK